MDLADWIAGVHPAVNAFVIFVSMVLIRESRGQTIEELMIAGAFGWVILRALGEHRG
ncbi:MAG: hypothetical protein ACRBBV_17715 [Paracoccaceae bacterium]